MSDDFAARVRRLTPGMASAAARVAAFLDNHRAAVLACSAAEIADRVGTSNATVIRTVQALGYDGLPDLKRVLAASLEGRVGAESNMRRTLAEVDGDADRAIGTVLEAHRDALDDLASDAARADIRAAVTMLHAAVRIGVFGIGPSSPRARYVAFQLSRLGRESLVLDATGWALADQLMSLGPGDAVIALAYGQPYREIRALSAEAQRLGVKVVLVTDAIDTQLARRAALILRARRGRAGEVALHATTLAALEAVMLGIAALDEPRTLARLADLGRLRRLVGP